MRGSASFPPAVVRIFRELESSTRPGFVFDPFPPPKFAVKMTVPPLSEVKFGFDLAVSRETRLDDPLCFDCDPSTSTSGLGVSPQFSSLNIFARLHG